MNANEYNRENAGRLWTLADLPPAWTGTAILAGADLDHDGALDDAEKDIVTWSLFAEEIREVQALVGLRTDGKLGTKTLAALTEIHGPGSDALLTVAGVEFRRAEVTSAPPPRLMPEGRTDAERSVARAWNTYGAEIARQAQLYGVPIRTALAFFAVEASGRAYDPKTGLIIIRMEIPGRWPDGEAAFRAQYGPGQGGEWNGLQDLAARDRDYAFSRVSWGLPQTMGFNFNLIGHGSAITMALAYQRSALEQIAGLFRFFHHKGLIGPIKRGDWRTVVTKYNGSGQVPQYTAAILARLAALETLDKDRVTGPETR